MSLNGGISEFMANRAWSPWRFKPTKLEELAKLEKLLRDMHVPHWSLTRYARYYQGAPDLLFPQLKLALWLLSEKVSPRQEREQAAMRDLGWVVIIPDSSQAAMEAIKARRSV